MTRNFEYVRPKTPRAKSDFEVKIAGNSEQPIDSVYMRVFTSNEDRNSLLRSFGMVFGGIASNSRAKSCDNESVNQSIERCFPQLISRQECLITYTLERRSFQNLSLLLVPKGAKWEVAEESYDLRSYGSVCRHETPASFPLFGSCAPHESITTSIGVEKLISILLV
jgi:hypothetical protein